MIILRPSVEGARLMPEEPEFIVTSDLQFPPVGLGDPLSGPERAFWLIMREGDSRYSVAQKFEAWPAGQREVLACGPHDLRYANPTIFVVRRDSPGQAHKPPGSQ
jgi:hypothetical protein